MRLAQDGVGTLRAVLEDYFTAGPGKNLATKREQVARISSVLRSHLDRPALEIRRPELQRAVDAYPAPVSAARAVGYVRPALAWAEKRELVRGDFDRLEKPQEERRQRVLSRSELALILPHLGDEYGRAARFLLLTAARLSEVTKATWREFDLAADTWTIPGSRRKDTRGRSAKSGAPAQSLVVPLSRQAIKLLEEIGPNDPGQVVFRGERGGTLVNWDRWLKRTSTASGTSGWSAHALRRTAATIAGEIGVPPHVVQVMLGHRNIGGQLHAGYNQSRYAAEHAEALQKLADEYDVLLGPTTRAGVADPRTGSSSLSV